MTEPIDYHGLSERLKSRAFRLATRDFNGDGAKLALDASRAIEDLLAERDALVELLRSHSLEMPDQIRSPVVDRTDIEGPAATF